MKSRRVILAPLGAVALILLVASRLLSEDAQPTNGTVSTSAVYVPDRTHIGEPLPDDVLAWDSLLHATNATADQPEAHFTIYFTNVATRMDISMVTNVLTAADLTTRTNIASITNVTPISVTILEVHPSCGCTTAQLPEVPWLLAPGTNGQIGITVDLQGKSGVVFKTVTVSTDHGSKELMVRIDIAPPVTPILTEEERAQGMAAAKVDRQAVFKGNCATCHAIPAGGKYGQPLYAAVCGVCHEAEHRATMVPDLHAIKTPTNEDFWRTWIMHGKPGSLMPAFSSAEGGPLNDEQISSLAAYLSAAIPSTVPAPPK